MGDLVLTFQEIFPGITAKWLIEEVEKRGVGADAVLRGTGLGPAWLKDKDAVLDADQYRTLVLNALHETGDPTLGLSASLQLNYTSRLGFWGYAILSCATWGESSRIAVQYWDICGSLLRIAFHDEGDTCSWEFTPALRIDREEMYAFAIEKVLSSSLSTIKFATGSPPPVLEARVAYARPKHAAIYKDYFRAELQFQQETNLVRMDASVLKRRVLTASPEINAFCLHQCRTFLDKLQHDDEMVETIRRMIVTSPGDFPTAPRVAKKLGLGPRTLRRRLRERNTSYRALLDEVRAGLATEYLTSTTLSIDEIAGFLGYAETAAFRRSFRRWTGKAPSAMRKGASP